MHLLVALVLGPLAAVLGAPGPLAAQPLETIVYLGGSGADQVEPVRDHADLISVLAPQAFGVGADGRVRQFDFENIHRSYRDRYTRFYREAAEAFGDSIGLSVAVVPGTDAAGDTPFQRYMQENWRGSFDLAALAEAGDFISFMTYAQHGGVTTPGPIAGLPWMRRMLRHALDAGVPPQKLSLGLPWYSGYWVPDFADGRARVRGREIHHETVTDFLHRSGARLRWLPDQGASYAFWPEAGVYHWLFVEDARSFRVKLGLLEEFPGLRGVSIWVLGAEDPGVWMVLEERRGTP